MKIIQVEQNSDEWFEIRKGKISGSRMGKLIPKRTFEKEIQNGKLGEMKDEYYKIIAERIAEDEDDEDPMERGHRLEDEAAKKFEIKTGLKVETTGIWQSDENDYIIISPDRVIKNTGNTQALEIKCLSSWKHVKALLTNEIPDEYEEQVLQYFIVNEDLKTLFFALYDPRIKQNELCIIEIHKVSLEAKIESHKAYQKLLLKQIEQQIIQLTF